MKKLGVRINFTFLTLILLAAFSPAQDTFYEFTFYAFYDFGALPSAPSQPFYYGVIAQGRDGNLYGSTSTGGTNSHGAAYKITPAGSLTLLESFGNSNGAYPLSGLTLGTDGNFYGATSEGGARSYGTVFKITSAGELTTLYSFTNGDDGALPYAPPIQGTDGNFYGTTCGVCNGSAVDNGSIYRITPAGAFTTLFTCDVTHCSGPQAPLIQGTDGNFYGTSINGGTNNDGTVFKITPAGALTVLYNFDGTHGAQAASALIQASDGNFYGTTLSGGRHNFGVIYRITPAGVLTVVHNNMRADGYASYSGLIQATDGNFYGVSSEGGTNDVGTFFQLSPTFKFFLVFPFDAITTATPYSLFQHTNGIIYGTTARDGNGHYGPECCGVMYSLNLYVAPFVSLVNPSGKVGKTVEILGQGFTGTTAVSFGGVSASFKVDTDTFLTATVPAGATTADVTVITPSGTLTSSKPFRVTP
jgi:uncharacterized repeat protein (TIGR03803 family)